MEGSEQEGQDLTEAVFDSMKGYYVSDHQHEAEWANLHEEKFGERRNSGKLLPGKVPEFHRMVLS